MSGPVATDELREHVDRYGSVAYLVTVAPETGRPHVVSVEVRWDGETLVSGAGTRTAANVSRGADICMVWSPPHGEAYSLIVDGSAELIDGTDGQVVSVRPTGAVLHRLAGADTAGPNCITVTVPERSSPPTTRR